MTRIALLVPCLLIALVAPAEAQRANEAQAARLMVKGDEAAAAGRLDEAVRHYERAAALAPGRSGPSAALAAVLFRMGKCDDALVHARRYRELKPGAANPQVDEVFQRCAPPAPSPPPISTEATPTPQVTALGTPTQGGRFRLSAGWITNVMDIDDANAASIGVALRLGGRVDLGVSVAVVPFMIIPEIQLDLVRGRRVAWFAGVALPILLQDEPEDGAALLLRTGLRFGLGSSGFAIEVSAGASKAFEADWSLPLWTELTWRP